MSLWPVEHFCPQFFSRSATGQRFIFIEVTFYKIHIFGYNFQAWSSTINVLNHSVVDMSYAIKYEKIPLCVLGSVVCNRTASTVLGFFIGP